MPSGQKVNASHNDPKKEIGIQEIRKPPFGLEVSVI
jgi:hypothetical protein